MKNATTTEVVNEMKIWETSLPEGLTIIGAMNILKDYSKPYTPNLADFAEVANEYSVDSLFWTVIRQKYSTMTRDEYLEELREEGRQLYED